MRPLNRRVLAPGLPALRMVPLTFLPLARATVRVSFAGPASVKRSLAPARARNVAGVSLTLRSGEAGLLGRSLGGAVRGAGGGRRRRLLSHVHVGRAPVGLRAPGREEAVGQARAVPVGGHGHDVDAVGGAVGDAARVLRPGRVDDEALVLRALQDGLLHGAVAEVVVLVGRLADPRRPGHAGEQQLRLLGRVAAVGEGEPAPVRAQRRIGRVVVVALVVLELVPPLRGLVAVARAGAELERPAAHPEAGVAGEQAVVGQPLGLLDAEVVLRLGGRVREAVGVAPGRLGLEVVEVAGAAVAVVGGVLPEPVGDALAVGRDARLVGAVEVAARGADAGERRVELGAAAVHAHELLARRATIVPSSACEGEE